MGLYDTYMRVTAAEAERLQADPESVRSIMRETPYLREYPKDGLLDLGKAWHGLLFVLDRAGLPAAADHPNVRAMTC